MADRSLSWFPIMMIDGEPGDARMWISYSYIAAPSYSLRKRGQRFGVCPGGRSSASLDGLAGGDP